MSILLTSLALALASDYTVRLHAPSVPRIVQPSIETTSPERMAKLGNTRGHRGFPVHVQPHRCGPVMLSEPENSRDDSWIREIWAGPGNSVLVVIFVGTLIYLAFESVPQYLSLFK